MFTYPKDLEEAASELKNKTEQTRKRGPPSGQKSNKATRFGLNDTNTWIESEDTNC